VSERGVRTEGQWYLLADIEQMQRDGLPEREISDFVRRSLHTTAQQEPHSGQLRVSGRLLAAVRRYGAQSQLIATARTSRRS
jgi:hypothetical protein